GSSVPACPVRAPVMRRIWATTANDDGPAGLSTSAMPAGSSARAGTLLREPFADDRDDLVDRELAGEPGGLPVAAATQPARGRRHVELVDARAQGHASRRAVLPRRLRNEDGERGRLDRAPALA